MSTRGNLASRKRMDIGGEFPEASKKVIRKFFEEPNNKTATSVDR